MNQVTVFGANGRVGRLVVEECLGRGYSVIASVHGHHGLPSTSHLKVVKGDIYDQSDVIQAIHGSNFIISCLGSWGTPKKDVLSAAMKNIIPAAEKAKVRRVISLTGAGANHKDDRLTLARRVSHLGLRLVAPRILKDGEDHLRLLSGSTLDWTVIRSPVMTNSANDGYRLNMKPSYSLATIPRAAVVKAMVDALEDDEWVRRAPFIHRP